MAEITLTADQETAITSINNMVITACPGSGKTTVIVEKIRKTIPLLKDYQGIIAVSFTVKASKELSQRSKRGALKTKSSFFGTIDHFCLSEIVFPFLSHLYAEKPLNLECKLYTELDSTETIGLPVLSETDTNLSTSDYSKYEQNFIQLYQKGIILLESVGVLACHIIESCLACQRYIRSKYKAVFIDEYQDSSEPQHKLFLSLLDLGLISTAVGDIQQSIYAWRGGNAEYIQELINMDDVFEHHIVDINHRCHPSITNYANRLFSPDSSLVNTTDIKIYRRCIEGTQIDVVETLNDWIPKIVKSLSLESLSDVAILVRNNSSLRFIQDYLTLPFRVYVEDPLLAINTGITRLFSALLSYRLNENTLINDVIESTGLVAQKNIVLRNKVRNLTKSLREIPEKDIQNFLCAIAKLAFEKKPTVTEAEALNRIMNDPHCLKQYRVHDESELQVMTLHKAKGLEFEAVIHLDLYEWVFPYRQFSSDFNNPIYPSWKQELNLHYVGITRAKSYCLLLYSTQRINKTDQIKSGSPSAFLTIPGLDKLYK